MPDALLDVHTHVYLLEHQSRPPTDEEVAASFEMDRRPLSVEDLAECHRLLFPGKHVEALAFGTASTYYDVDRQNDYVATFLGRPGLDGLALLAPGRTESEYDTLIARGFVGFKPYDLLVPKPRSGVTIRDMIPDAARAVIERRGLIVMLHVPRPLRIADRDNIREVTELCEECPSARVILAHIGRSYGPWYIEQAIEDLALLPNLYYDVAALDDADSICVVLEHVPHTRLMWGTDLPIAALRGKHLCVNRQCLFLTREKYPWSVSSERPGELNLTFFAYETVRALKFAARRLGLSRSQVEDVFYGNARALIDRVRRSARA